jgi:hypothetical protein
VTDRLDALLRDVIHDLATDGERLQPEERDRRLFAVDATDRGFQYRTRRRAGLVGVVVLVLALAAGIPYGLSLTRGQTPRVEPAGPNGDVTIGPDGVPSHLIKNTSGPIQLVDNWYVLGNNRVLNPTTSTYDLAAGSTAMPSPNGRWVAIAPSNAELGVYRVVDLRNGGAGRRFQIPGTIDHAQWSPEGDRLLFARPTVGEAPTTKLAAVVLDVITGTTTTTVLDVTGFNCAEVACHLTWMPSGAEIALTIAHSVGEQLIPVPTAIQTFTPRGERLRRFPVAGYPTGPASWSPNGHYAVVRAVAADGRHFSGQVVDVSSGQVVTELGPDLVAAAWVDDGQILLWEPDLDPARGYDQTDPDKIRMKITLVTRRGTVLERWPIPLEIATFTKSFLEAGPFAARLNI